MNRRVKAFWEKHEVWLGPSCVALALIVGYQAGANTATNRLTAEFTTLVERKDARIKELHERANAGTTTILPAVDAAVQSAKAAAKSADASAKAVEQMVKSNEKGNP